MRPELINAVLRRGSFKCAWCGCALNTGRVADRGVVCQLGLTGDDDSMVASCVACNGEFVRRWRYSVTYSIESAKRLLGRHGATGSGPFVDYLQRAMGDDFAFTTALDRVEAQRNAPLDVVREKGQAA